MLWDLNSDSSEISELESCSDPEYANGARQFKEDHPVPQVQRQANRPTERRSAERAKRDGRLVAVEDSMQDLKEGMKACLGFGNPAATTTALRPMD